MLPALQLTEALCACLLSLAVLGVRRKQANAKIINPESAHVNASRVFISGVRICPRSRHPFMPVTNCYVLGQASRRVVIGRGLWSVDYQSMFRGCSNP